MKITRTSIITQVTRTLDLDITQEQLDAYQSGKLRLQDAFPQLPDALREFIHTGITGEEWLEEFGNEEEEENAGTR